MKKIKSIFSKGFVIYLVASLIVSVGLSFVPQLEIIPLLGAWLFFCPVLFDFESSVCLSLFNSACKA